jgi:hypothetical protein
MIELLLQRDEVDLNAKDRNGQSPLSWQREGGHDAVVKLLLLRKDVDTYSWDKLPYNTTILGDKEHRETVIELLLEGGSASSSRPKWFSFFSCFSRAGCDTMTPT